MGNTILVFSHIDHNLIYEQSFLVLLLIQNSFFIYAFSIYINKHLIDFWPIPCRFEPNLFGFYIWFNGHFILSGRCKLGNIRFQCSSEWGRKVRFYFKFCSESYELYNFLLGRAFSHGEMEDLERIDRILDNSGFSNPFSLAEVEEWFCSCLFNLKMWCYYF